MKRVLSLLILSLAVTQADVVLPPIISNHMVLQKTAHTRIWGKADPGEEVSVTLDTATAKTTAGADGKWALELDLRASKSGPFELIVQGKNRLALSDVVVGEVWVASGQSNMDFGLASSLDGAKEVAASTNPMLRKFFVKRVTSAQPLEECEGEWLAADPKTSANFTAVGYFFGKRLQQELKEPIGIIHTSWGGTPVEAWTSAEAIDSVPDLKAAKEKGRQIFDDYPNAIKAYVERFGQWLKDSHREDKPTPDPTAFAGPTAGEGWTKVSMPLMETASELPASGVFWLRKEIPVTPETGNQPLHVNMGPVEGFEGVYWNGKLLEETQYQELTGKGAYHSHHFRAELPKEAVNVLALRIYAPVQRGNYNFDVILGNQRLSKDWEVKIEFEFPPLTAPQLAEVPQPPPTQAQEATLATTLYGGMINPLLPYTIRGVIWYQGEANVGRGWQYRTAFPLMIQDWRARWKQGDFPFYFCQLANYNNKRADAGEDSLAEVREAQSATLKVPNTGQAVLIDLGECDIHPRNKKDVGERLAAIALARDYGQKIAYSGPVYESMQVEGGKVRLKFSHVEGGLVARPVPATYPVNISMNETAPLVRNSPNSELEGFAICGADKRWIWADAKIEGDSVIVSSDQVPEPIAVRYAWAGNPTCNLYNQAGFPASPFRTDDFPAISLNAK